jgi:lysozyme
LIDNVLDLIKRHEGRRLKPYKDTVGKVTIGYGRNLDANGISAGEAEFLLETDIAKARVTARRYQWFPTLDAVRRAVVLDMIFNLGPGGFRKFVQTRKAIKERRYFDAARGMMQSKWATQVPTRAKRLAKMMRTGAWPT